jgi:hypothetical protein
MGFLGSIQTGSLSLLVGLLLAPALLYGQTKEELRDPLQSKTGNLSGVLPVAADTGATERVKQNALERMEKVRLSGGKRFFSPSAPGSSIEYTYLYTPAAGSGLSNGQGNIMGYNIANNLSVDQLPFALSLRGNNAAYPFSQASLQDFYRLSFDHKKYMDDIQGTFKQKNAGDLEFTSGALDALEQEYERSLQRELEQVQKDFASRYGDTLQLPPRTEDLSRSDMASLGNVLLPDTALQQYRKKSARLQALKQQKDAATLSEDPAFRKLESDVARYEAYREVHKKVGDWKQRFEGDERVRESKRNLASLRDEYARSNDPVKSIRERAELNGAQRLFLGVRKLDLGQFGVQSGPYSLQDIVHTGINTDFQHKSVGLGMIYGKNNTVNPWMQSGLYSPVTSEYSQLLGFTLRNGHSGSFEHSVSVNLFDFRNLPEQYTEEHSPVGYMPSSQRKDITVTYHAGIPVSKNHSVSLDISKSFGSFSGSLRTDSSQYRTYDGIVGSTGESNFAGAFEYTGQIAGSRVRAFFKKAGLGYNNPGNIFLRRGETQYGLGINRKFYQQKLSAGYLIDYRTQHFDPEKRHQYTALNNRLQLGYRINRDTRVGLTFQKINNHAVFSMPATEDKATTGNTTRVQLDGGYRVKLNEHKVVNTVMISRQEMDIPMMENGHYRNRMLLLAHTTAVVLDKNVLSVSLIANRSDNRSYYFNTSMFSLETNYAYSTVKDIRLSSGVGYYDNEGWNRQVGLKQQVTAVLSGKMNIDLQVSYKKAVRELRPELANQFFLTTMLHYNF